MQKKLYILLITLCLVTNVFAQGFKNLSYSLSSGYGFVMPINTFVNGENVDNQVIDRMYNFTFRIGKDTDGSKSWHNLYNGLHYGLGLFHGIFNYSKNLGNPYAIYGYVGFNFLKMEKLQLRSEMAIGFSGIWDCYSETNRMNVAVSTPIESYIHANIHGLYFFNDYFQMNLGASFIHFSNGTMKRPNKGLNILSPEIGLVYRPTGLNFSKDSSPIVFAPHWQTLASLYYGQKGMYTFYWRKNADNTYTPDTARGVYPIFGLQLRHQRALTLSHNLGLGMDLTYNESLGKSDTAYYSIRGLKDTLSFHQRMTFSVFLTYEYNIHNFSIFLDPSFYIYAHKEGYFPTFHQRIGMRYQFPKGMYVQVSLRAKDFSIADYIEWGIGYRIRHKKNQGPARIFVFD